LQGPALGIKSDDKSRSRPPQLEGWALLTTTQDGKRHGKQEKKRLLSATKKEKQLGFPLRPSAKTWWEGTKGKA